MYDVVPNGGIAWYKNSASAYSGIAQRNTTNLTGDFRFSAVQADQTTAIHQSTLTVADALNVSQGQTFQTTVPFDRVSMRIGTYVTTNSGFTALLFQDVGGRWQLKQSQQFRNVLDNAEVMMNFAHQPAGKYLLEITNEVGSIAWYRNASDVYPGTGLYALTDGSPVSGDRWFKVYRGKYKVEVPQFSVNTTIDAGNAIIMANESTSEGDRDTFVRDRRCTAPPRPTYQ